MSADYKTYLNLLPSDLISLLFLYLTRCEFMEIMTELIDNPGLISKKYIMNSIKL